MKRKRFKGKRKKRSVKRKSFFFCVASVKSVFFWMASCKDKSLESVQKVRKPFLIFLRKGREKPVESCKSKACFFLAAKAKAFAKEAFLERKRRRRGRHGKKEKKGRKGEAWKASPFFLREDQRKDTTGIKSAFPSGASTRTAEEALHQEKEREELEKPFRSFCRKKALTVRRVSFL